MQKTISDVYTLDPSAIVFDDTYTVFNPVHRAEQYEATKANIKMLGQLDPVYMLNKVCVDGRHRVKIAKELDIHVRCIDVNTELSKKELITMCNQNTMSGRDFNTAQKAIQALALVTDFGFTAKDASMLYKVDRRQTTYASTIRGLERQDLLDNLMDNQAIQLDNMERPSKSIEVICKNLKKISEVDVIENTSERIVFNPEALIKTESGKAWFYERMDLLKISDTSTMIRADYMELANLKFKVQA